MQIHELLRDAWDETEKAELPEHIHKVAFTHALAMLGGAAPTPPATTTGAAPPSLPATATLAADSTPNSSDGSASTSTDDLFEELASETGVSRDKLERVLYFHEGVPGIAVPSRKLGKNKAEQTRAVALLLFCAHHFALNTNELSVEVVREACETLTCYDSANFSSTLDKVKGTNYTGPKGKKVLRLRPNTVEKFQQEIAAILGEEA